MMKRQVISFTVAMICIAGMCFSCNQKDTSTPVTTGTATISAMINGTSYTFNNGAVAQKTFTNNVYTLVIGGYQGSDLTTSDQLLINVLSTTNITTKSYVEGSSTDATQLGYSQYTGPNTYSVYTNNGSSTNPVSVTITTASDTAITGTFSGDIYLNTNLGDKKIVSGGQFRASFH